MYVHVIITFGERYGEDVIVSAVTVDGCACVFGVCMPIL